MVDVVVVGLKLKCPKYGLKESAFYVWYRYSFCFLNFHEEWFSASFAKGGNKGSTKEWALIVTTTHTLPGNFTQLGILKTDVIHSQWMRARTNMVCLYCQKGETEFLQSRFNTKTVWKDAENCECFEYGIVWYLSTAEIIVEASFCCIL